VNTALQAALSPDWVRAEYQKISA